MEDTAKSEIPPKLNPERNPIGLRLLKKEEVKGLFANLRPAPSHSLLRPTPKFEDIMRMKDFDFDKFDTSEEKFNGLVGNSINGNYVIDLGAGRKNDAYRFAWHFDASGYIGIEANDEYASVLRREMTPDNPIQGLPDPHVFVGDMVDALKRVPNNCGNVAIFLAGIDHIINYTLDHYGYVVDLQNEIDRILPIGGRVIKYASIDLNRSFKRIGGVRLTEGDFGIWEKK